ncbi:MAG TPA: hypothetical protein VHQ20_02585 [Patescibacteria group bacterium]|nr:hypothetical protein [Patescibacteria group bacterium]
MPKAEYTTSDGTKVSLEGNAKEIAELIKLLSSQSSDVKASPKPVANKKQKGHSQKSTPTNLVASLIDGNFFRKPKDLAAIKIALEEAGHYYPVTTLSPTLLRFVRSRQLRRIKDKNKWLYTG